MASVSSKQTKQWAAAGLQTTECNGTPLGSSTAFPCQEGEAWERAENLLDSDFLQAVVTMDASVWVILLKWTKSIFISLCQVLTKLISLKLLTFLLLLAWILMGKILMEGHLLGSPLSQRLNLINTIMSPNMTPSHKRWKGEVDSIWRNHVTEESFSWGKAGQC